MLHAVSNVKRGNRFAFLPFLYDEAAAKLREENLKFLDLPGAQQQVATSAPTAPEMVSSKIV
jgi:hypothetical protein